MDKLLGINVIGDIHGRTNWKELIDLDCINIFVGDYFDPYEAILYDSLVDNFLDIIELKKNNPNKIILLIGNHDAHYMNGYPNGESSRYNKFQSEKIKKLFEDNYEYFHGIVYFDKNTNHIISHAGITKTWYNHYFNNTTDFPDEMAFKINELWKNNKMCFSFMKNMGSPSDYYGDYSTHSPLWVRTYALLDDNYFQNSDIIQVIGHTQIQEIIESNNIVCVDILGRQTKSYKKFYL